MKTILTFILLLQLQPIISQADIDDQFTNQPDSPQTQPTINNQQAQNNQINAQKQVQKPNKQVSRNFKFQLTKQNLYLYRYEIVGLFAVFMYLIMYQRGKNANFMIATKFCEKTQGFILNNFAHTGFSKQQNAYPLASESASDLIMYASGREHCDYMQISFNLRKRQDLLYHLIYQTIYPEKDSIVVNIPVSVSHPVVFAVTKRKMKSLIDKNIDLMKLARTFDVQNLNNYYCVLGESIETVDYIVDSFVARRLKELVGLVVSIHYTDQKLFSDSDGHLRAVFYASAKNEQKYLAGLELLFYLVDRIYRIKVSSNYKTKASAARQAFNATKQKQALVKHQEELRKNKQQKRRKEEAWLRSLPPQKQKKQDEKRKKKQVSKMYKSKTMKMM